MRRPILLTVAIWVMLLGQAEGRPATDWNSLSMLKRYLQAFTSSSAHQGTIHLSSRTLEERGSRRLQRYTCQRGEYDVISASSGLLQTPVEGNKYPNDFECGWRVAVTPGKVVRLEWLIFKVEDDSSCSYDVVDVFDGPDVTSRPLGAYCGTTAPPTVTSTSNHVTLRFSSDDSVRKRGIRVRFTEVDADEESSEGDAPVAEPTCGGSALTLTTSDGDLYSPGYTQGALTTNCEASWVIRVPSGQVQLTFPTFSLMEDDDCWADQLIVFDGPGPNSQAIGMYCGQQPPPTITSSANTLFIYLLTSDESKDRGFHAQYTTINAQTMQPTQPSTPPSTTTTQPTQPSTPPSTTTTQPTQPPTSPSTTLSQANGVCGGHVDLTGESGQIDFPGHGLQEYPNDCHQTWTIHVPTDQVQLVFESLYIEPDSACAYDSLKVYDGAGSSSPQLTSLCGSTSPAPVTATGSTLHLLFTSDTSVGGTGFQLTYSSCHTCASTTTTQQPDNDDVPAGPVNCTFDDGLCGWSQSGDDDFDWTRNSQNTPTDHTGPMADHSRGNNQGSYLYVESSSPRESGDKARLVSPLLPATDGSCLTFWYSMHGTGVGALRVLLRTTDTADEVVWEKTGNRGQGWILGKVSVASGAPFRLVFEATTTGSIYGDIGIDDVSLSLQGCSPIASHCGRSLFSKRVIGGEESQRHQWPWAVFIKTYSADGAGHVKCGGTLIEDRWVLTASHCLEIGGIRTSDVSKVKIHLGEHNVEQNEGSDDYMVAADRIIVHPQRVEFGPGSHDIALLRLQQPVELSQMVNVVCLPAATDTFPAGTPATAAGWGLTGNGTASSEVLLHVNMEVVSRAACSSVFGTALVSDDVICAGHDRLEKTSCRGDSGGPLVTLQDGAYTQIGVVSWGAPCGKTGGGVPSGYANVRYFLSWIETTIANNS